VVHAGGVANNGEAAGIEPPLEQVGERQPVQRLQPLRQPRGPEQGMQLVGVQRRQGLGDNGSVDGIRIVAAGRAPSGPKLGGSVHAAAPATDVIEAGAGEVLRVVGRGEHQQHLVDIGVLVVQPGVEQPPRQLEAVAAVAAQHQLARVQTGGVARQGRVGRRVQFGGEAGDPLGQRQHGIVQRAAGEAGVERRLDAGLDQVAAAGGVDQVQRGAYLVELQPGAMGQMQHGPLH